VLSRSAPGFTLVELMVAIAVFATVIAIGGPALRVFIENGRIRSVGESWKYGLSLARNEAVRLNGQVEFVATANGWEVRRVVDGVVLHEASGRESIRGLALQVAPADTDRVTFDPFGRAVDPNSSDGSEPMAQVDIRSARPPATSSYRPLRLQLLAGGLARLCDPGVAADDPRTCL